MIEGVTVPVFVPCRWARDSGGHGPNWAQIWRPILRFGVISLLKVNYGCPFKGQSELSTDDSWCRRW